MTSSRLLVCCRTWVDDVLFCFTSGSRSHGRGLGALKPTQGSGGDDNPGGGGGGGGERRAGAGTPVGNLNEQIVAALAQLQEDMQSVLERLHTLEALTATQVS